MPKLDNREYRQLTMLQVQASRDKRIDSDYYIEGYATTFNQPYILYEADGIKYYEVIDRHALDGADMSDVILQYDHTGKVFARKSNKTLIVEPDDNGLFVCADLSKSSASKDFYEEVSSGLVTKMSWGFVVAKDTYDRNTRTRTILKIKKVYDVSGVSIPANPETEIQARSYFDGVIEVEKQELLERRKKQQKIKILIDLEEIE